MVTNSYITRQVVSPYNKRYSIVASLVGSEPQSNHGLWWWVIVSTTYDAHSIILFTPSPSIGQSQLPLPEESKLQFPIADNRANFQNSVFRIASLSAPVQTAIEVRYNPIIDSILNCLHHSQS